MRSIFSFIRYNNNTFQLTFRQAIFNFESQPLTLGIHVN